MYISAQDINDARRRGELAKLLFDNNEMAEVIGACQDEDNNTTPSGWGRFNSACRRALQGSGLAPQDRDKFIREMWEAAKCARAAQQSKPCW